MRGRRVSETADGGSPQGVRASRPRRPVRCRSGSGSRGSDTLGGVLAVARRALGRFVRDDCATHAAAIAYSALFAIFPLLLCVVALVSPRFQSPAVRDLVLGSALAYLPGSAEMVEAITAGVVATRGTVGPVAAVVLLGSGLGVFQAIVHGLNVAFGVPNERGFLATALLSAALLFAAGGVLLLSLAVTAAVQAADALAPLLGAASPRVAPLGAAVTAALTALLGFATFAVLYKVAPNTQLSWREVAPGAAVAALLFEAAKWGFVVYLATVANYAAVYGAIGAVIALLTWCYLCGLILLLGAEVSAARVELGRQGAEGVV
jgi:membrane protein